MEWITIGKALRIGYDGVYTVRLYPSGYRLQDGCPTTACDLFRFQEELDESGYAFVGIEAAQRFAIDQIRRDRDQTRQFVIRNHRSYLNGMWHGFFATSLIRKTPCLALKMKRFSQTVNRSHLANRPIRNPLQIRPPLRKLLRFWTATCPRLGVVTSIRIPPTFPIS